MLTQLGLFFGAFLDALIGPNLFVPGEPFLIAAGYQLHQGVVYGVIAVLLGGWLGDQASYAIGRRHGRWLQTKLVRWQPKTRRSVAKCKLLMKNRGRMVLVFARLLGPVAWVVPFIAGVEQIPWRRFSLYSFLGLVLGVGQFVVWGYLLSYGIDNVPWLTAAQQFFIEHQYLLLALLVSLGFTYIGIKRKWSRLWVKSALVLLISILAINYSHFFWFSDDIANVSPEQNSVTKTTLIDFEARPGRSGYFKSQAVNVVYIGNNPNALMQQLGWIENRTFSRHDIEMLDYLALLRKNTPPVSDLYWQGQPQNMAYQLPGTLDKRSHIRWWYSGVDPATKQPKWVGAISYDDGFKLTAYAGIVTILHRIDPNVDEMRDALANQIKSLDSEWQPSMLALTEPSTLSSERDYYTDGRVLVVRHTS
ncbi:LssY C-terminal domain-containing protein [Vibrio tapetis subsp. quintayensis]|uniref:LssY C-terminal domain-containing protein n=1 Tax=Vibrio tapetis TaxID=52443 RepID=UPI0025B3EC8D|nr:LssY C-terminal domain-containing protein [Vibrio tapetis]MDN3680790.1 LssY C-terminal domain-containing protein [Vibrio tapetis subsp. quintayensis]